MKILAHLSGGFDSTAVVAKLLKDGHTVAGLFFNLGQMYLDQEEAAVDYAHDFFMEKYPDTFLGAQMHRADMINSMTTGTAPSEYIPVRNLVLASHSANIAIARGFEVIAVGNKTIEVRPDDPYSFSDCSIEFYRMVENIVNFCSEGDDTVKVTMPLVKWESAYTGHIWDHPVMPGGKIYTPKAYTKGEVIQILLDAGMDLTKLWSCYKIGKKPCGICYHCEELKKAFNEIDYNYEGYFIT